MTLKDFLQSKVFFKQLAFAFLIIVVVIFGVLQYLDYATNHGEEIPVPDIRKMNLEKAEEALDAVDLEYVVLDTVDFKADYPPFTIVQQDPLPKVNVKDGRKIYVKLNSAGYSNITVPDIIQKTYRAALPALKTVGLEEGKKTYKPYLAKDVVLEIWQNGKKLKKGDKVLKASKIDLVLGDGKAGYEEEAADTIKSAEKTETEN